jgi:predicted transcriptional regulator
MRPRYWRSVCALLPSASSRNLKTMNIHLTSEQEARITRIAAEAGTDPERVATEVVARYLDDQERFLAAVEKGLAAAQRGEFIEEDEMESRVDLMFRKT